LLAYWPSQKWLDIGLVVVTWTSLGGFGSALEGFRCDGQGAAANMSKLLSMQDVWAGFPDTTWLVT